MATTVLESSSVSAFCESVAIMLAAGIQTDEAVSLLGENMEDGAFKRACDAVILRLIAGEPLAILSMARASSPCHVVDMVGAGEASGRTEPTLRTLALLRERRTPVRQDAQLGRLPRRPALHHDRHPGVHGGRHPPRVRPDAYESLSGIHGGGVVQRRGRVRRHRVGGAGRRRWYATVAALAVAVGRAQRGRAPQPRDASRSSACPGTRRARCTSWRCAASFHVGAGVPAWPRACRTPTAAMQRGRGDGGPPRKLQASSWRAALRGHARPGRTPTQPGAGRRPSSGVVRARLRPHAAPWARARAAWRRCWAACRAGILRRRHHADGPPRWTGVEPALAAFLTVAVGATLVSPSCCRSSASWARSA